MAPAWESRSRISVGVVVTVVSASEVSVVVLTVVGMMTRSVGW